MVGNHSVAVVLAGTTLFSAWALGQPAKPAEADTKKPEQRAEQPAPVPAPHADQAQPRPIVAPTPGVVVHPEAKAADERDGRVNVGAVRISIAPWASDVPAPSAAASAEPIHEVPNNTLGPGEPRWLLSDRAASERKIVEADGDLAKAESERPNAWYEPDDGYGSGYWGAPFGAAFSNLFSGGIGRGRLGLRGPVTTSITHDDSLGSTAQRAFFQASYPRNNGIQDALDRAVSQFGRNATPPIARIQNDVDRAFISAQKEHPVRPPARTH